MKPGWILDEYSLAELGYFDYMAIDEEIVISCLKSSIRADILMKVFDQDRIWSDLIIRHYYNILALSYGIKYADDWLINESDQWLKDVIDKVAKE
jgi:hypothetical protein